MNDLKIVTNQQTRGGTRRSTKRRSRRQGGDSVGNYFGDAWSLAKRTAVGLNEIRKLINVEQKFVEVSGSTVFNTSGAVSYLSAIAQGDDVVQREGNSIKVQRFHFRYNITFNAASTLTQCRVLIVRDLQNQGATITANDVLESVGTVLAPLAMLDFTNGPLQNKRFSVVYDNTLSVDTYHPINHDTFVSNHDCHVYFRGSANTVANAGNGSYFLVVVSSEAVNTPTINYNTRTEFTDN